MAKFFMFVWVCSIVLGCKSSSSQQISDYKVVKSGFEPIPVDLSGEGIDTWFYYYIGEYKIKNEVNEHIYMFELKDSQTQSLDTVYFMLMPPNKDVLFSDLENFSGDIGGGMISAFYKHQKYHLVLVTPFEQQESNEENTISITAIEIIEDYGYVYNGSVEIRLISSYKTENAHKILVYFTNCNGLEYKFDYVIKTMPQKKKMTTIPKPALLDRSTGTIYFLGSNLVLELERKEEVHLMKNCI